MTICCSVATLVGLLFAFSPFHLFPTSTGRKPDVCECSGWIVPFLSFPHRTDRAFARFLSPGIRALPFTGHSRASLHRAFGPFPSPGFREGIPFSFLVFPNRTDRAFARFALTGLSLPSPSPGIREGSILFSCLFLQNRPGIRFVIRWFTFWLGIRESCDCCELWF